MTNLITSAVNNTLSTAKVKGIVTVTPATISIEEISNKADAIKLEKAFIAGGMKSLGVCDMEEIEMGTGFCLTISIK